MMSPLFIERLYSVVVTILLFGAMLVTKHEETMWVRYRDRVKHQVVALRKEIYECWTYCTQEKRPDMGTMREHLMVIAALWSANGLPKDGLKMIEIMQRSASTMHDPLFVLRERLEALLLYTFYLDLERTVEPANTRRPYLNLQDMHGMEHGMRFLRNSWTAQRGMVLGLPTAAMRHIEDWLVKLAAKADGPAAPEAPEADESTPTPAPEPAHPA